MPCYNEADMTAKYYDEKTKLCRDTKPGEAMWLSDDDWFKGNQWPTAKVKMFKTEREAKRFGEKHMEPNALDIQIGGNHYKSMAIQPIEYCFKNGLNVCQSKVIKYITRYKIKDGLTDLKKARHMIDLLIELEYGSDGK